MSSNPTLEIRLERLKIDIHEAFTEEFALENDVRIISEFVYGRVALHFRAYLYGQAVRDFALVRYPDTWVEAVKQRFAPAWLLRKWPLVMRVERMRVDVYIPGMPTHLQAPVITRDVVLSND